MNKLEENLFKKLFGIEPGTLFQIASLEILNNIKEFIEQVEEQGLTNEQWFIDWEDEMNKLSVKDHNKLTKPTSE